MSNWVMQRIATTTLAFNQSISLQKSHHLMRHDALEYDVNACCVWFVWFVSFIMMSHGAFCKRLQTVCCHAGYWGNGLLGQWCISTFRCSSHAWAATKGQRREHLTCHGKISNSLSQLDLNLPHVNNVSFSICIRSLRKTTYKYGPTTPLIEVN